MKKIESTPNSPEIVFDEENNLLEIIGNSYLSNPIKLYQFLLDWVSSPIGNPNQVFKIDIKIGYCSSSSIQILNQLMTLIDQNLKYKLELQFIVDEDDKEDSLQAVKEICFNTKLEPAINFYN